MPNLSTEARFDAPRLRTGAEWVFNTRGCSRDGAVISVTISVPFSVGAQPEYRFNVNGTWTTWTPVPTGEIAYRVDGLHSVAAAQCVNYQVRGTTNDPGVYTFDYGWTDPGSVQGSSLDLLVVTVGSIPSFAEQRFEGTSCLGTGEYGVRVVARATPTTGARVIGELSPYSGNWARLINATSEASVRIPMRDRSGRATDACDIIQQLSPWRHELEIHRDGHLVWAGPITDLQADPRTGQADITAKDLSAWWAKRFLLQDFNFIATDLATIFEAYVNFTQLVDPYGLTVETTPTGILGDRTVVGKTVLAASNELNELDRTGVDWTIANRTAFVGGITINGQNPRIPTVFTDESFREPPITRLTGTGMGNLWYIKGRSDEDLGQYGYADSDGFLIMEKRTEQSIEDPVSANAAAKGAWDRSHTPLAYVQGDNSLAASAEVDIQELVPGVEAPVALKGGGCVPLNGVLRLERVAVNFTEGNEEVSVYMQPRGATADE